MQTFEGSTRRRKTGLQALSTVRRYPYAVALNVLPQHFIAMSERCGANWLNRLGDSIYFSLELSYYLAVEDFITSVLAFKWLTDKNFWHYYSDICTFVQKEFKKYLIFLYIWGFLVFSDFPINCSLEKHLFYAFLLFSFPMVLNRLPPPLSKKRSTYILRPPTTLLRLSPAALLPAIRLKGITDSPFLFCFLCDWTFTIRFLN